MSITRRDFLKIASSIGAATVLELYRPSILKVFAQAASNNVKLVWIQGQSDSGCTVSLLQGVHPDLYDAILKLKVVIPFHPTIMPTQGDQAIEVLRTIAPDVLVVEGSIPTGDKKYACTVGEVGGKPVPIVDWLLELAGRTKVGVVAFGACAADGGIPAAKPNPTNAKSVSKVLGKTVINIPGCPGHPDWLLLTLASVLSGVMPELNELGRPKAFFDMNLHDGCDRRGYYDQGDFAESFTESDITKEKCLWKLGCRGPVTDADCVYRKWNSGLNVCMNAGAPCIGCVHPGFPDKVSPFYEEIEKLPTLVGVNVDTAGKVAVGAAAVGVAAHAVRRGVRKHPESKEE